MRSDSAASQPLNYTSPPKQNCLPPPLLTPQGYGTREDLECMKGDILLFSVSDGLDRVLLGGQMTHPTGMPNRGWVPKVMVEY